MYEDSEQDEGFPDQKRVLKLFAQTLELVEDLFPEIEETRWSNKADFYSLFVAFAAHIHEHEEPDDTDVATLEPVLAQFARRVDRKVANSEAKVPEGVANYADAVQKGVNEKARRAVRHRALVDLIEDALGLQQPAEKPKLALHALTKKPVKKLKLKK